MYAGDLSKLGARVSLCVYYTFSVVLCSFPVYGALALPCSSGSNVVIVFLGHPRSSREVCDVSWPSLVGRHGCYGTGVGSPPG